MSGGQGWRLRLAERGPDAEPAAAACNRGDLAAWSRRGGPLPRRLAVHVLTCAGCAARVSRINNVRAGLALLGTQAVPAGTRSRANARALRMLRRAARASQAARRVLRTQPNLSPWQRARIQMMRSSLGIAAAVLVLLMRAGVFRGLDETHAMGQQLVRSYERHMDPDREWFNSAPRA